jgi:holliday junction DNA helicase RuvA
MIGHISGKIIGFLDQKIILKTTSGVGYLITVNQDLEMILNESFEFFVLDVTRDTGTELYGFTSLEERLWVEKLIAVDGVGPKTATIIVYTLGISQIKLAIDTQDDQTLAKVKGISSKTAKKIILELHNKDVDIKTLNQNRNNKTSKTLSSLTSDFTETLASLGYKRGQIVNVISNMKQDGVWQDQDLNDLVKTSLRYF